MPVRRPPPLRGRLTCALLVAASASTAAAQASGTPPPPARTLAEVIASKEAAALGIVAAAEAAWARRCPDAATAAAACDACTLSPCAASPEPGPGPVSCAPGHEFGTPPLCSARPGRLVFLNASTAVAPPGAGAAHDEGLAEVCAFAGRDGLDAAFAANAARDPLLARQRFAGAAGSVRTFPGGTAWGPDGVCAPYADPRVDSFFVSASSGPKNVVLVVDVSGSMGYVMDAEFSGYPRRLDYAVNASLAVIDGLSPSTYFAVIAFSNAATSVLGPRLVPATEAAKAAARARVRELVPGGGTYYGLALHKAFDVLNASAAAGVGVGCADRTALLFLTDGVPTDSSPRPQDVASSRNAFGARIFTYAFGPVASVQFGVLTEISCDSGGVMQRVAPADATTLVSVMARYYTLYAGGMYGRGAVTWSDPVDAGDGQGLVTTAAAPAYDADADPPRLLGVGAVDVRLDELTGATGCNVSVAVDALFDRSSSCPPFALSPEQLQAYRAGVDPCGVCPSGPGQPYPCVEPTPSATASTPPTRSASPSPSPTGSYTAAGANATGSGGETTPGASTSASASATPSLPPPWIPSLTPSPSVHPRCAALAAAAAARAAGPVFCGAGPVASVPPWMAVAASCCANSTGAGAAYNATIATAAFVPADPREPVLCPAGSEVRYGRCVPVAAPDAAAAAACVTATPSVTRSVTPTGTPTHTASTTATATSSGTPSATCGGEGVNGTAGNCTLFPIIVPPIDAGGIAAAVVAPLSPGEVAAAVLLGGGGLLAGLCCLAALLLRRRRKAVLAAAAAQREWQDEQWLQKGDAAGGVVETTNPWYHAPGTGSAGKNEPPPVVVVPPPTGAAGGFESPARAAAASFRRAPQPSLRFATPPSWWASVTGGGDSAAADAAAAMQQAAAYSSASSEDALSPTADAAGGAAAAGFSALTTGAALEAYSSADAALSPTTAAEALPSPSHAAAAARASVRAGSARNLHALAAAAAAGGGAAAPRSSVRLPAGSVRLLAPSPPPGVENPLATAAAHQQALEAQSAPAFAAAAAANRRSLARTRTPVSQPPPAADAPASSAARAWRDKARAAAALKRAGSASVVDTGAEDYVYSYIGSTRLVVPNPSAAAATAAAAAGYPLSQSPSVGGAGTGAGSPPPALLRSPSFLGTGAAGSSSHVLPRSGSIMGRGLLSSPVTAPAPVVRPAVPLRTKSRGPAAAASVSPQRSGAAAALTTSPGLAAAAVASSSPPARPGSVRAVALPRTVVSPRPLPVHALAASSVSPQHGRPSSTRFAAGASPLQLAAAHPHPQGPTSSWGGALHAPVRPS